MIDETRAQFDQPFGDDADYLHQDYPLPLSLRGGALIRLSKGDRELDGDWED